MTIDKKINQVKIFIEAKRIEVKDAEEGWLIELDLVTLNHPDLVILMYV